MTDQMTPHNLPAERAVLGSLLIDPDAYYKVASIVEASDFYVEKHRWIFGAYADLIDRGSQPDYVTLCDELDRRQQLVDMGGSTYLLELINGTPSALRAEHYAHIIERTAVYRRIIYAAGESIQIAMEDGEEPDEVIGQVQDRILQATARKSDGTAISIRDVADRYYDHVNERRLQGVDIIGLPTGFKSLDKMLGGLQRERFYVLAGRPGMGKSGLSLSIALTVAKLGKKVAIFSFEMGQEQLFNRWVAGESEIDSNCTFTGKMADEEWTVWLNAVSSLAELGIFIDEGSTASPTITYVRNKARALHMRYGLDLVVVDYIQLMEDGNRGKNDNREREVARISRGSKRMAMELKLPVLACCQLSRAVEMRKDKHPMLSDLRESGTLEQDSDVVMFMYRDDYYNPDTDQPHLVDLDVAKWRDGPTGRVNLYYRKETNSFHEVELHREQLPGFSAEGDIT